MFSLHTSAGWGFIEFDAGNSTCEVLNEGTKGPREASTRRLDDIFIYRKPLQEAMDREVVLAQVDSRIRQLPGVIDLVFLDPQLKEKVVQLEKEAETNGAAGGLLPFRNLGVWESLSREVSMIIVFESEAIVLGDSQPLIMVDQQGNIIGEFVNEEKKSQLEGEEDVHFLSDDFVIYTRTEIAGDPIFIMPVMDFKYIEDIDGVTRVTSGSISTLSDHLIRCHLDYESTKHWTHLVGFDIE